MTAAEEITLVLKRLQEFSRVIQQASELMDERHFHMDIPEYFLKRDHWLDQVEKLGFHVEREDAEMRK